MTKVEIIDNKSIRNYIHNTLNISKDEIRNIIVDEIHNIVKEQIKVVLNDKEHLQQYIQNEIIKEIRRDYNKERRSYPICTVDEIYNKIDKIIHEEVLKRLVVTLREPDRKEEMLGKE